MSAPHLQIFRLIEAARPPERADRSALGTLPARAVRYCDAVTTAAGFGWYVFPPLDLSLYWDGHAVFWTCAEVGDWLPLGAAQFPGFSAAFDNTAPAEAAGCAPPFLTALPESGLVQIWTGLIARTAPDWSLLVRSPANLPQPGGIDLYEGVLETDRWFGPLFVNLRLTRTHSPIDLRTETPLAQIQPLPRIAYAEATLDAMSESPRLSGDDWADYVRDIVRPNDDPSRPAGGYAVAARRRRKRECPFSADSASASPAS